MNPYPLKKDIRYPRLSREFMKILQNNYYFYNRKIFIGYLEFLLFCRKKYGCKIDNSYLQVFLVYFFSS